MSIDYEQLESSQRQHDQTLLQNERICNEYEKQAYEIFNTLKPEYKKDGDRWCVLLGEDVIVGITGFGKSLHLAILDWWENIKKPINTQ
jgi:hypothetical protein